MSETPQGVTQRRYGTAVAQFEKRTEWLMAVLALLFLACYAWPILQPNLNSSLKLACLVIDDVIWVVFGIEFIWRVTLARSRGR